MRCTVSTIRFSLLEGLYALQQSRAGQLMRASFGVGLPHLGVEALIAMAIKLLMHYGCQTATGWFMRTSLSLVFVELGLSFQPLQESYKRFGFMVTHSWFKMLWEKLSKFGMKVVVADQAIAFPQEATRSSCKCSYNNTTPMISSFA